MQENYNRKTTTQVPCLLITGATSGIGLALVKEYLALDYQVIACGRNLQPLVELQQRYAEQLICLAFDITQREETLTQLSHLPVTVNKVILNAGTCEYIDIDHFDSLLCQRVLQTNFLGVTYCIEALLPQLKPGAELWFMSSSVTYFPFAQAEVYGASKAALDYFVQSLTVDLMPKSIFVGCIKPGFVKTPLTDKNDFTMPLQISTEQAVKFITQGIARQKRVIQFPPLFIMILKVLNILPLNLKLKFAHFLAGKV